MKTYTAIPGQYRPGQGLRDALYSAVTEIKSLKEDNASEGAAHPAEKWTKADGEPAPRGAHMKR